MLLKVLLKPPPGTNPLPAEEEAGAGTAQCAPESAGDRPGARAERGAAGTSDHSAGGCGNGGNPHSAHGPPGQGGVGRALRPLARGHWSADAGRGAPRTRIARRGPRGLEPPQLGALVPGPGPRPRGPAGSVPRRPRPRPRRRATTRDSRLPGGCAFRARPAPRPPRKVSCASPAREEGGWFSGPAGAGGSRAARGCLLPAGRPRCLEATSAPFLLAFSEAEFTIQVRGCVVRAGSNKKRRESETKKMRRLRRREEGRGRREERAGEAREPGAGTALGWRLSRSRSRSRPHTAARSPAHARPLPGRPGAGHRGGDPAGRARPAPAPAPTPPPLRSAAARLARRPRLSCRKMVNDRWKTTGGAAQLEDRPRDKPQVRAGTRTRGPGCWPGGGRSGRRGGHPAPEARAGMGTLLSSSPYRGLNSEIDGGGTPAGATRAAGQISPVPEPPAAPLVHTGAEGGRALGLASKGAGERKE
ncbi:hypothetical protein P7K49_001864 [Saguinus oedipus]|uniref:Uncharacterized protein n=1 Tax=Saguinus oedipus TaxID=9490 RepID=A0ABQ9WFQ5_SAGOE|nr:hypothetical protein P7K49_001864 [Saguinus oedipus]